MTQSQSPKWSRVLVGRWIALGLCAILAGAGCGGAVKQTNTETNTAVNPGSESQPGDAQSSTDQRNQSESQPSK